MKVKFLFLFAGLAGQNFDKLFLKFENLALALRRGQFPLTQIDAWSATGTSSATLIVRSVPQNWKSPDRC